MSEHRIYRQDGALVVEAFNPTDPSLDQRTDIEKIGEGKYRKIFRKKKVYGADEYALARAECLGGANVLVLGPTGYSSIKAKDLAAWGLKPGAYEAAVAQLLATAVRRLRQDFAGIDVRFAHGASDCGIDMAAINVATELECKMLGHSCPEYALYVEDSDVGGPMVLGENADAYKALFADSIDVLVPTGGREATMDHYAFAAMRRRKPIVLCPVLAAICPVPPGGVVGGQVVDAVSAMMQLIRAPGAIATSMTWPQVVQHLLESLSLICSSHLTPEVAFAWRK